MEGKKSVHVAVLHTGWIRWELAAMLFYILSNDRRYDVSLQFYGDDSEGRPVASNRCRVMRDMPKNVEGVLMLDSDVVPPPNLLDVVGMGDVVGCPSPIWRGGYADGPVVTNIKPLDCDERIIEVGTGEAREVAYIGGGAFWLSRKVLDDPALRGAFHCDYDDDGVAGMTADYVFCDAARAAGYKIFAAMGCPLRHIKSVDLVTMHDISGKSEALETER